MKRHHHQEFIRFLNVIAAQVPKKKTVRVIVDNYAAHKHPKLLEWIEDHPRFVFHFTPTSASWLNAVESSLRNSPKSASSAACFAPSNRIICPYGNHTAQPPQEARTWPKTPKLSLLIIS
jgi:hypothetical protein